MPTTTIQEGMLEGVSVLEFAAIGPVPWGVHSLAQMGADITCIQHPSARQQADNTPESLTKFGRNNIYVDLKTPAGHAQVCELIGAHDVLVEGMRPGVMERLGLSPAHCHDINPELVYARVTGWGQHGPLADRAGHDINYISLCGVLHAIGPRAGPPVIPLNLLGDYGGGGTYMLIGILAALLKARSSGKGSVIDVAMLDGAANLMALQYERLGLGQWHDERGTNKLDGGTPWYSVYQTQCGGYMAVGAIEPKFYTHFVQGLGLKESTLPNRNDIHNWPALRRLFTTRFQEKPRDEWARHFELIDACVTPVLSMTEAMAHPHNQVRQLFSHIGKQITVRSAPRFSVRNSLRTD